MPQFLYFDLGNVLLHFSHRKACEQMGMLAGVSPDLVWEVVFASGLEQRLEAGEITDRQFYDHFCQAIGSQPDYEKLRHAASDIFTLNTSIVPLLGALRNAGYRMGILSNTCSAHWTYCAREYGIIGPMFEVFALSYELGAGKPNPKIYEAAANLVKVEPQEIFFTDDIATHIESARKAGFDAVQYTSTPALVDELLARGLRFNY